MDRQQIDILTGQGRIAEAEAACDDLLRQNPNDLQAARTAAWAFLALMKHHAAKADAGRVAHFIWRILQLQLPESEETIHQNVVWGVRAFFQAAADSGLALDRETLLQLFRPLYAMPVNMRHNSYSALLNTALRVQDPLSLLYIIKFWNLNNLQPDDFRKREINGQKVISLAEKAYYTQCKAVIALGDKDILERYLPRLRELCDRYPHFDFLPYYLAKTLILSGRKEEALEVLKPFAKKKSSEFWVWQLIGDCHTQPDDRMMFYCKAVSCRTTDEMIVKTRLAAGRFMLRNGKEQTGKFLLEKARQTYLNNGWHLPPLFDELAHDSGYQQIIPGFDRDFVAEQALRAESFLFGQLTTVPVMVTAVNTEHKYVRFITEQLDEYKGGLPRSVIGKIQPGSYAFLTVTPLTPGQKANVRQVRIIGTCDNPRFYRPFSGEILLLPQGGGVVDGVYVPAVLLTGCPDGGMVAGTAMRNFDKKKNKWGWKAMTMQ